MTGRARALVLDLDGTLVDSHAYTFAAVRHACAPWAGVPSDESIHALFGPPERVILSRLVPPQDVETAYRRLQAYYAQNAAQVRVQPAVARLLADARRAGIPCGLFTGRAADSTGLLLQALGQAAAFDAVVAGDSGAASKPAPDGVLLLARRLGVPTADILVVGDSPLDIAAAQAAGARAAFAAWFVLDFVAAPAGVAVIHDPDLLRPWLGLPFTAGSRSSA